MNLLPRWRMLEDYSRSYVDERWPDLDEQIKAFLTAELHASLQKETRSFMENRGVDGKRIVNG